MLVYVADKKQFIKDCDDNDIEAVVGEQYRLATGRRVAAAETRSWKSSLDQVAKVLRDDLIDPQIGVAVELHIPQTSKRIDVSLSGFDEAGRKKVVVIELKQWEHSRSTDKDAIVRTVVGGGEREMVHPSYQAWSYAALLEGFNEAVHTGGIQIAPCAFLHNHEADGQIDAPQYREYLDKAPLFLKGSSNRDRLRAFIRQHVRHGDSRSVLYELVNGRIRPSKALADSLKGMLASRQEFVLIDEQKRAFELAAAAAKAASSERPRVVVIEGGPGTGKTVLAINLLVRLLGLGLNGKYVSKNAAPRQVYEAKLVGSMTRSRFSNLFTGSGSFIETPANTFDFLLVDEAHRLNEKSGLYGNLGDNQVGELVRAARCTVFFLDEDQRVTLQDIGGLELIERYAHEKGAVVERITLASQFRCGGSGGYLAWLDDVLGIRETANSRLYDPLMMVADASNSSAALGYEFRVFDDPAEMHRAVAARNSQNSARVVAGYCWPWRSKKDSSAMDIEIGDYRRQWNLSDDGSLWILKPNSIEQVGCIHTCQGLEVDTIGVIIGPDLIVRNGEVQTNPQERDRHDKTIKGWKARAKVNAGATRALTDRIIKNTYRTLMTRGMKACFVYSADKETREYLRGRM